MTLPEFNERVQFCWNVKLSTTSGLKRYGDWTLNELSGLLWLLDLKSCQPCQWHERVDCSRKILVWVWCPSFAREWLFLDVHTYKPQPLSNSAQDGFSEKWYSRCRSKQLLAFGSFSWITSSSFNSQLPFFFIPTSSNQKRGVNDSLAPDDLLNNWTVMYQRDS